jgi:colicin import membrane protein
MLRSSLVDVPALKKEGNEAFKKGKWEDAAACYTAAIDNWMTPQERAVLYVNRAAARLKQPGNVKSGQALADTERAILLDASYAKAHFRHGQALSKLRRPADAVRSFERALQLAPADTAAQEELARARAELGGLGPNEGSGQGVQAVEDAKVNAKPAEDQAAAAAAEASRRAVEQEAKRVEEELAAKRKAAEEEAKRVVEEKAAFKQQQVEEARKDAAETERLEVLWRKKKAAEAKAKVAAEAQAKAAEAMAKQEAEHSAAASATSATSATGAIEAVTGPAVAPSPEEEEAQRLAAPFVPGSRV